MCQNFKIQCLGNILIQKILLFIGNSRKELFLAILWNSSKAILGLMLKAKQRAIMLQHNLKIKHRWS